MSAPFNRRPAPPSGKPVHMPKQAYTFETQTDQVACARCRQPRVRGTRCERCESREP